MIGIWQWKTNKDSGKVGRLRKRLLVAMPPFGGLSGGHRWSTSPPRCISAAGTTSSSPKRWRKHFVFFYSASATHKSSRLPARDEESNFNVGGKREKRRVDPQPVAAMPTFSSCCADRSSYSLWKMRRWGGSQEGENWQTQRYGIYSPPCNSSLAHPEASPKRLVKQINK